MKYLIIYDIDRNLQRGYLYKKIRKIISKCGLKRIQYSVYITDDYDTALKVAKSLKSLENKKKSNPKKSLVKVKIYKVIEEISL